jgi:serine/threonine-protein kinase
MEEVLAMLDRAGVHAPRGEEASYSVPPPAKPAGGVPKPLLIGGGVVAIAAVAAAAWFALAPDGGSGVVANPRDPVEVARSAINNVLPSVGCTWLEIESVQGAGASVRVAMRGVAGDAQRAQNELERTLTGAGLPDASIDLGDVAPITAAGCAALDTYRQVRASDADRLMTEEPRFEMVKQPAGAQYAGKEASNAVIDLSINDPDKDFAIVGIEPSGAITTILPSRAAFEQALAGSERGKPIEKVGPDKYRLSIDLDHQGWSGIMLVTGKGPFDQAMIQPPIGARGPDWQNNFLTTAAERGWMTEMVWFESVNNQPM